MKPRLQVYLLYKYNTIDPILLQLQALHTLVLFISEKGLLSGTSFREEVFSTSEIELSETTIIVTTKNMSSHTTETITRSANSNLSSSYSTTHLTGTSYVLYIW